jgi:hypothetical protein
VKEVDQEHAAVVDASDGLKLFQLKTPGIHCQERMEHMFAQRQIIFKTSEEQLYTPNAHLGLTIKPCNIDIIKHMQAPDLSKRAIIHDCAGNGATLNLAARKLNQEGFAHRHCGLVNTEDKLRKLRNTLQMSQSVAKIE